MIYPGNREYALDKVLFIDNKKNVEERNNRCGNPSKDKVAKKVRAINILDPLDIIEFDSMKEAEVLGYQHQNVSKCCNGKLKSYKGYYWEYFN